MMKKILIILLSSIIGNVYSQNLSKNTLETLEKSIVKDNYFISSQNAVRNNDISKLAVNKDVKNNNNHLFKHKVDVKGITNQFKSGRCWMFTSLNVLRPKAIEKFGLKGFEFSTSYLYFWDILEKSNLFLENIIATSNLKWSDRKVDFYLSSPVGDGGVWNSFTNLVEKYGLVPMAVMNETNTTKNTRAMQKILNKILRIAAFDIREENDKSKQQSLKLVALKKVYRLLALNIGIPPKKFSWEYKDKDGKIQQLNDITPIEFAKQFGSNDYSNYVMLMDDPTRPYNKLYEIESDRNVMEGKNWKYINLPASKIKKYALKSIQNNEAMYFSCDVGKQLDRDNGYLALGNYNYEALLGIDLKSTKRERVLTKQSGSSHGMNLVGVDTDENGKITKWLLENSWGDKSGHKGFLTMTDEWFDQYMFRLVIQDKFIDSEILKILDQKPIMLEPWDPMFEFDK